MGNRFIQKIPLNPPLLKGEDMKKDSEQVGMTNNTFWPLIEVFESLRKFH